MSRTEKIACSIRRAILQPENDGSLSTLSLVLLWFRAVFTLWGLPLIRYRNDLFSQLRQRWHLDETAYETSFQAKDALQAKGDMGYSGSTFFTSKDGRYIVKSVPRQFEHSFFRDNLLPPYYEHMQNNIQSLLTRITDFLCWKNRVCLGGILGLAPTYHIAMENLLTGQEEAKASGGGNWQSFDLKPQNYFYPERDIAGGRLASEATKSKLADRFDDKIVLRREQADFFFQQLEQDTKLLEEHSAVDYSLFLIRIPLDKPQNPLNDGNNTENNEAADNAPIPPEHPPFAPPSPPTWRTGIMSADNKYVFRAAILDFFWSKHKTHARLMTLLIKSWNLVDWGKGPMSITTTPKDYRERFLNMCKEIVEVKE